MDGERHPTTSVVIRDERGRVVPEPPPILGCGNLNPLGLSDFILVEAGEIAYPFGWGRIGRSVRPDPGPGSYSAELVYDVTPPPGDLWVLHGRHDAASKLLRRLVDALPRGRYVSNAVKFTLVETEEECPRDMRTRWLFPERDSRTGLLYRH